MTDSTTVASPKIFGLDPDGRGMSLLWASPALTFTIFPFIAAFRWGIGTLAGGVLFALTLAMIALYICVWLMNPTPSIKQSFTWAFSISHGLLLVISLALVAWSVHLGNDGSMLNMMGYSFAAWIMQAPRRWVIHGTVAGIIVFSLVQWTFLPQATVPFGVIMAVVMTYLSRMSIESNLQQKAQQQHMLAIAHQQERLRIGADLHDILGHSLTAIVMKAQVADKLLTAARVEDAHQQIGELVNISRSSLAEIRAVVEGIRSLNLDDELSHATALLESSSTEVTVDQYGVPSRGVATSAFARVLREATTNILAHSQARHVQITVTDSLLEVRNDGYRPSLAQRTRGSGTGLPGLREQMDGLGSVTWGLAGQSWVVRAELGGHVVGQVVSHHEASGDSSAGAVSLPAPHTAPDGTGQKGGEQ